MSEANPPVPAQAIAQQGSYEASSLVVPPRPNEIGFALREDEFQILCEGGLSESRAYRDLFFGALVGAFVGLAGVLATTDWGTIWQPQRRVYFLLWCGILLLIVAASATGCAIYQLRLRRTHRD